jgi:spore coat protein SA
MKVAFICTEKLPVPPIAGGAVQIYINGVTPYLAEHHDLTIFGVRHPELPEIETKGRVTYIRVPGKNEAQYLDEIKKKLVGHYDLVHVFNRPKLMLALSSFRPDLKFSLSIHNEMFHSEKIPYQDGLKCIERAEFINAISGYIADTISSRFPQAAGKLRVVYSAADSEVYKTAWSPEGIRNMEALKKKHGLEGRRVVLYVGRLSVKKGVHVLLRAVEKLMKEEKDIALAIVGSKWYGNNDKDDYSRSVFQKAGELPGPVITTGFVPPSQIPEYYNLGDVFVCASQWNEPLARVHYEAMAAGLPIITTNRGGNAEVVENGQNGFVIDDYSNPDAFAGHIRTLLNDKELALEMGKKGRVAAETKFNWKRVADEILGGFQ